MVTKHLKCFVSLLIVSLYKVNCDDKISLTYVIDDTLSMFPTINQLKNGVDAIFDTVLNSNESQIEDFVLVTFNDPDTKLRTITKDKYEFKSALSSIILQGGHDCPEFSLSGIMKGIENSRPGSTIYVFTDASAKDYDLYDSVKNFAIARKIQVVFVLTGTCGVATNSPSYSVYKNLADDTNGQAFTLGVKDIPAILNYVKENLKSKRVILTTKKFQSGKQTFDIVPGEQTKDTIISVTGFKPTLKITKPEGKGDTQIIVHNNNIMIVKILEQSPKGVYTLEVSTESDAHVVVSVRTEE